MEKIDTDWKTTNLKSLAKLFNPDWAPLTTSQIDPLIAHLIAFVYQIVSSQFKNTGWKWSTVTASVCEPLQD